MQEFLVSHQVAAVPCSHVRSTLLQSSLSRLRELGHLPRWRTLIGESSAARLEQAIAPEWIEVSLAQAHYRACDALALSAGDIDAIGQKVGEHMQNVLVNLGVRTARAAGFDPKVAVLVFKQLFGRVFRGGSMAVKITGPKDLEVELRGLAITESSYYRAAYCGHLRAAARFVGVRAVYVKPVRFDPVTDSFVVSVAWV